MTLPSSNEKEMAKTENALTVVHAYLLLYGYFAKNIHVSTPRDIIIIMVL